MGYSCYTYVCIGVPIFDIVKYRYDEDDEEFFYIDKIDRKFDDLEDAFDYIRDLEVLELQESSDVDTTTVGQCFECSDYDSLDIGDINMMAEDVKNDLKRLLHIKDPNVQLHIIKLWH